MEPQTSNQSPLEPQDEPQMEPENKETTTEEEAQTDGQKPKHSLHFPALIEKFGVWPVNIGLFFFYNNVVSLFVLLIGLIIMTSTGVDDQQVISQKLGGLSVISTVITLGLTLIYSRKFYFTKE